MGWQRHTVRGLISGALTPRENWAVRSWGTPLAALGRLGEAEPNGAFLGMGRGEPGRDPRGAADRSRSCAQRTTTAAARVRAHCAQHRAVQADAGRACQAACRSAVLRASCLKRSAVRPATARPVETGDSRTSVCRVLLPNQGVPVLVIKKSTPTRHVRDGLAHGHSHYPLEFRSEVREGRAGCPVQHAHLL